MASQVTKNGYFVIFCLICVIVLIVYAWETGHLSTNDVKYYIPEDQIGGRVMSEQQQNALARARQKQRWIMAFGNRTSTNNKRRIHLLVSGYMRSGSTFTASIFARQANTFYVYEPLWEMSVMGYFTADDMYCDSLAPYCRNVTEEPSINNKKMKLLQRNERSAAVIQKLLADIYDCSFHDIADLIRSEVAKMSASFSAVGWREFKTCIISGDKKNITRCIQMIEFTCAALPVRLAKVIRVTLNLLAPLFQLDKSFRVLHLFRDPRSVIYSRLVRTEWYPLKRDNNDSVYRNAKALCFKMQTDLKTGLDFMTRFPERFLFVRYEDLLGQNGTRIQQFILTFFQFSRPWKYVEYQGNKERWRLGLGWKETKVIQDACGSIMEQIGYKVFKNNTELRDIRVKSHDAARALMFLSY